MITACIVGYFVIGLCFEVASHIRRDVLGNTSTLMDAVLSFFAWPLVIAVLALVKLLEVLG